MEFGEKDSEHLAKILALQASGDLAVAWMLQHSRSQTTTDRRPLMAMVLDDLFQAFGPEGFDSSAFRRLIAEARSIAIVSCEPLKNVYDAAAETALQCGCSVLIETRPEQEASWFWYVLSHKSQDARLCVATVPRDVA